MLSLELFHAPGDAVDASGRRGSENWHPFDCRRTFGTGVVRGRLPRLFDNARGRKLIAAPDEKPGGQRAQRERESQRQDDPTPLFQADAINAPHVTPGRPPVFPAEPIS
jgi:hypothetical protein